MENTPLHLQTADYEDELNGLRSTLVELIRSRTHTA